MNNTPFFNPMDFGAARDGKRKDTAALQGAIDACAAAGGGTVRVPPGRYLIAPVYLRSNVELHLEAGAVLLGSQDKLDYAIVTRRYAGTTQPTIEALVNAEDAEKVAITGRGTIDGQGEAWWGPIRNYFATPKAQRPEWTSPPQSEAYIRETPWARPRLVELMRCRDVLVEGVTLRNSGFWNLHLLFCDNVAVHRATLLNPANSPNGDGIDLDSCRNARVSDCFLDVNDDAICLKSGWNEDGWKYGIPTENVVITNCVVRAGHGGVVIGSDMSGGVRNVAVSNCVFHGTEIGLRLKAMRGRGGVVENILYENIVMDGVGAAVVMDLHYWKPMPLEPVSERTPRFRNIRISRIEAVNGKEAGYLHGLEELPLQDITFDGVRIQAQKPMWMRHVRGLDLRHLRLDCPSAPELSIEDAADISIDHFRALGAHEPAPAIRLTRVKRAGVTNSNGAQVIESSAAAGR